MASGTLVKQEEFKMVVRDLLSILECGTDIIVSDRNTGNVLLSEQFMGMSYTKFDDYLDTLIRSINTSCDDCDIEIVL